MTGIVRSSLVISLNDLIAACRFAANRHFVAASACEDRSLQIEFEALAQDRLDFADELAKAVAAQGDIPRASSKEKEMIDGVFIKARATLNFDQIARFFEDSRAREEEVAQAAENVLDAAPDLPLAESIKYLREDAAWRIGNLTRSYKRPTELI